ncbi:hypothetical protein QYE76_061512 [Lolium multiflorum]|uniref:Uncharacterized protein n=1 Tax=Lolium multiflorum TaxID=4521 RepID=A0AAD8S418_LOLMU|nr:hypothetical protein QYE76_061512 [Lolium multiflorum]
MAVESSVVATVILAVVGIVVVLGRHGWRLLAAALAGGSSTARTLARIAEAWRRRRRLVPFVVAAILQLDDRCRAASSSKSRRCCSASSPSHSCLDQARPSSMGRVLSAGTRSFSDLAIASRIATSSAAAACSAAWSVADAASRFVLRFRPRGGDRACPSRMTMAPALRPRLFGGDAGSAFTGGRPLLGVAGGADPNDLVVDRDAEPDDEDEEAMRCGIQELPCRHDTEGTSLGGGIYITG